MIDYTTVFNETKNLSVLFVEDYEPLRLEMAEILEELFRHVTVAADGEEAFDHYTKASENDKRFDLVISDIQMPIMDGVALSAKIREANDAQIIIILSGHTDSEYLLKLINIGISKFLSKPINHNELFTVLHDESKKVDKGKIELPPENPLKDLGEGYIWDTEIEVLKYNDLPIELTKYELILLRCLINKTNYICTTTEIMDVFYDNDVELSEKNIRNLVFKLRKRVPEKCISSVYGLGYKFVSIG